ncbi:MAG: HAD family phosphatase [Lachnospiraceae bacterium]|nr:HAD family phosphatase [Lachnospiraceae bacterium]
MLSGAIFDMDGLMFDTERVYRDTWVRLADLYGVPHNPEFPKAVCGTSGSHMVEVIHSYYPQVDAQRFCDDCLRLVDESLQEEVPVKKGLYEILEGMKRRGVKMAVASSSLPDLIRRNLSNAGVYDYFDAVISGTEVAHGKPAPDIFLLAAERIGLPASQCYVFEDGRNGIYAGVAAGCRTIMIPDLTEPDEEIRRICYGIYEDLDAAFRALEKE